MSTHAEGNLFELNPQRRTTRLRVHFSSFTDVWATPMNLFDELHREFGFDLDVCAVADNAKCDRFFSPETDGLTQEWTGTCWMNPPYGRSIGLWVKKAYESAQQGATVVCLLPARTDTEWWHEWVTRGEVRFIRGRLRFGSASSSAPFPSAIVIFRAHTARTTRWTRGVFLRRSKPGREHIQ